MPPRGRRPDGASGGRSTPQQRRQDPRRSSAPRRLDQEGPIPPLALAAASVDGDVSRNRISPTTRGSVAHYLVIVAPSQPLADLPHALFDGLHRDLDRCLAEQRGLAVIVDGSGATR